VVDRVAGLIHALDTGGGRRLRVAVDGRTAAGKTSFGHEVAVALAARGRRVLRASLDDFKRPWSEAHLYDRRSGEGYYRNAFDLHAIRRLLLEPAGPSGNGLVALCAVDPLTQVDHSSVTTPMPVGGVLVVDGVFACRPELSRHWDLRIWLEVDAEQALRRGVQRDAAMVGSAADAESLHRDRYRASEEIYLADADPRSSVEVVVDNSDITRPLLRRPAVPD
jgi:uridine kinase